MNLGDRMKRYEAVSARTALHRAPVVIRVDGRAFHTFTRGLEKPFSKPLMAAMRLAALEVAADMQGFKFAYIQSDEVSFCLTDYDDINTQGWFDYDINKMVSISASLMTAHFNRVFGGSRLAFFDSRAFTVPQEDVINNFLWRAKDWERNSLQMYCRAFFSHKLLHQKKREDMHEMLHGIGKNWTTDLDDSERNGTFLLNSAGGMTTRSDIPPSYENLNSVLGPLLAQEAQP